MALAAGMLTFAAADGAARAIDVPYTSVEPATLGRIPDSPDPGWVDGAMPPTDLGVASIEGDRVILRWTPPAAGARPSGYLLAWYDESGAPLGALPLAGDVTAVALSAPPRVYGVTLQTLSASGPSDPSARLRVNAGTPEIPAPPTRPIVGGQGEVVTLAWTPDYGAGVPRRARVEMADEAGGPRAAFAIDADHVTVGPVPPGTYSVVVAQTNEVGEAGVMLWHAITVPRECRPPAAPVRLGVFTGPGRLGAVWDPSPLGDAPDGYDVAVTGAWSGEVALGPGRVQEAAGIATGVYSLRVRARNACGISDWTPVQTVAVP